MKKKISLFLLFALTLCFSTSVFAEIITFNNKRGDVSISYPEGWFVKEYIYNNPYSIFLSREKVEKVGDIYKVGISILKFYHHSWYVNVNLDDLEEYLNYMVHTYYNGITYSNKRIIEKDDLILGGVKFIMREISFDAPLGFRNKLYFLCAIKNDIYVQVMFEAPEHEFEDYRQVFDESARTMRLFSSEGMLPDDVLLYREIDNLILTKMRDKNISSDPKKILSVFYDAMSMSPSYAKTRLLRGSFIMHYAKNIDPEIQKTFLEEAEKELRFAIELYNKYPQHYDEFERKLNISQCYYLLGDIYYYPYNNKEKAKKLYEESLKYFDYLPVKEALEKYK